MTRTLVQTAARRARVGAAWLRGVLLVAVIAACATGCPRPAPSDAGTQDGAGDGTTGDGADRPDGARRDGGVLPFDAERSDATGVNNGACSTIMNLAPAVAETTASGVVPSGSGGAVVRGWYFLTATTVYSGGGSGGGPLPDAAEADGAGADVASADGSGPVDAADDAGGADATETDATVVDGARDASADVSSGPTRQSSLLVSGGAAFVITRANTQPATTANYRIDETMAVARFVAVCPSMGAPEVDSYDATPTQIVLYRASERRVDTYTRQP